MRSLHTAVAVLSLLSAPVAWAEDPLVAHVGSTVRVTARSVSPQPIVGILDGANESHLRLATHVGPEVIPRNAVEKIEWSRGLHRPVLKRGIEGAVIMGAFGFLFAKASDDPNEKEQLCNKRPRCAAVGAGAGAVLGLISGALATPKHDWVEIAGAKRASLVLRPRPGGAAAALMLRW
jgi:hypothetical protein